MVTARHKLFAAAWLAAFVLAVSTLASARADDLPSFTLPVPRLHQPDPPTEQAPPPRKVEQSELPRIDEHKDKEHSEPKDLTCWNFWSAGWDEPFHERAAEGHALRIPLIRTQPGFLLREMSWGYTFFNGVDQGNADQNQMNLEMLYPWNRRFLTAVDPDFAWINSKEGGNRSGPTWTASAWLQLIDTKETAVNVQLHLGVPSNGELGENRTRVTSLVACFQDLGGGCGLQANLGHEMSLGPGGGAHHFVTYAVSFTCTMTEHVACFSYFTPFLEGIGNSDIDDHFGRTSITFIPGIRWEMYKDWWMTLGVEVAVTAPRPFDQAFHLLMSKEF